MFARLLLDFTGNFEKGYRYGFVNHSDLGVLSPAVLSALRRSSG